MKRALGAVLLAGLCALSACDTTSGPKVNVARVEVNVGSATILVGTTTTATAHAFDLSGKEIANVTPNWKSDATAVASVDKAGVVTAHALGAANIGATIGGVTASTGVTVVPLPVASISIAPNGGTMDRGQTLQLNATVLDQFGGVLTDRVVTWASSAPGIASVSSSGNVNALAAGSATITATSESRSATVAISVIVTPVPGGPSISSITPALLTPGVTAMILGTGFGTTTQANEVRIAGVIATVTSASATSLTVQVPAAGFGCEPTRNIFVQVANGGAADAKSFPLQVAPQRLLRPGDSQILTAASDAQCFELPLTGGHYVVSVYNTATNIQTVAGFTLRGALGLPPASGVQPVALRAPTPPPPHAAPSPPPPPPHPAPRPTPLGTFLNAAQQQATADAHRRIMEENADFVRRNAAQMAANLAAPRPGRAQANISAADQSVGTILPFRIPNIGGFLSGNTSFCTDNFSINARVAYNGTHAIIVEDTVKTFAGAPTLAGQIDSLYTKLGQEFDNVMYDLDRTNFGDPLRMDDVLAGTGKIVMLFSPRINSFTSIEAFVVTCDFFPVSQSPSSNHTEVFYSIVPIDPGTNDATQFGSLTPSNWYRRVRSTVVHEVKHIAAYATRIRDFGSSFEEFWLEEGLAREAEEIWARNAAYNGLLQRGNATYASTVFCDIRPDIALSGAPQCVGKPYALARHFADPGIGLYDYLRDNELKSPLGPKPAVADGSFYASAWSLTRWAADNTQTDESAFFTALVHQSTTGVANLAARVGLPWEQILGEWSLALYLDDFPGFVSTNAHIGMPSWNYRSIFAGLNNDLPATFPLAYPLVPRSATYGDFSVQVPSLAGGTFSLFLLGGTQTGRQLLQLLGANGGLVDPGLRVAIARID